MSKFTVPLASQIRFVKMIPRRRVVGAAAVSVIPKRALFGHENVRLEQLVKLPVQLAQRIIVGVVKADDLSRSAAVVAGKPVPVNVRRVRPEVELNAADSHVKRVVGNVVKS